jgi:3-methyladenine DNA glycosylase AlkD
MAVRRALVAEIRRELRGAADPERASQQQKYMKSPMRYHGVAMPDVRRIAKHALRRHPIEDTDDCEHTVRHLWDHASRREEWYAALTVATAPATRQFRSLQMLPLYRHLITTGAWWDVVDDAATHLVAPLLREHPLPMSATVRRWSVDEDVWLRRAAILSQIGAKERTDTTLLTDVLEPNLDRPEFFLRKAVGWALRDLARTDPDWVGGYVLARRDRLSPLSQREATRHLRGALARKVTGE